MSALDLLSGDAQTFLAKIWASRVHIHHTDPADLVGLLSFDDVDHLLTSTAIRTPAVRIAKDGSVLPQSDYTRHATLAGQALTGLLDPGKVFALFDEGATVVLQGLHRYWPPLGALVGELELALGHPCQANAYLTPPGSQGFAVHSDSHDVFVFQTHGSKVWEVHEHGEQQTVVLEPGVSMYLPTGTPHAARAQDTVSLHVTIGINQVVWKDVLDRALADVLDDTGPQHLPAGYLDDPALLARGLAERLESLAASLRGLDPAAVADAEVRRFLTTRTLWQRGGLQDRISARDLTDTTELRRRAGHPCVLRPEGDQVRVLLGDRELLMPGWLTPALDALRSDPDPASGRPRPRRAEPAGALPPPRARGAPRSRPVSAYRCAAAALARDEPLAGTASTVRAFLLVENAGPWGTDALHDARLPDEVKDGLRSPLGRRRRAHPAGPPARGLRPGARHPGVRGLRRPRRAVDGDQHARRARGAALARPRRPRPGRVAGADPGRRTGVLRVHARTARRLLRRARPAHRAAP